MSQAARSRIATFLALAAAIGVAYSQRGWLEASAVEDWVRGAGALGPLVFIATYAIATVLFVPGSLITLAGGALFGPWWGTVYCLIGATLGAAGAFLVARYLASDWVNRKVGGGLRTIVSGVEAEGWRFVAFARLVPLFPFNLLNYALGLTRIPFAGYVVATAVFMVPGAFAYTWLGYVGREAAGGGEDLVQKAVIAMALMAALAFLPRFVRRLRAGRVGAPLPGSSAGGLSAAELRRRLEGQEPIVVLDVRPAADYAGEIGHIDGSLNIPLDQLPARLSELDPFRDRPLAVICRTNRMSAQAVALLESAGFRKAMLVTDGMLAWSQEPRLQRKEIVA